MMTNTQQPAENSNALVWVLLPTDLLLRFYCNTTQLRYVHFNIMLITHLCLRAYAIRMFEIYLYAALCAHTHTCWLGCMYIMLCMYVYGCATQSNANTLRSVCLRYCLLVGRWQGRSALSSSVECVLCICLKIEVYVRYAMLRMHMHCLLMSAVPIAIISEYSNHFVNLQPIVGRKKKIIDSAQYIAY